MAAIRDPKTGRFVKATAAPAKPAVPSPAEVARQATLRRAMLNQSQRIAARLDSIPKPKPVADRRANGYRGVLTRAELARRVS